MFREQARERFGLEESEESEGKHEFEDYLLFSHRDEQGRCLVDHFLAQSPGQLDPDTREAFGRLGRSLFGFFRVESLRPGEHVDLRRIGDDTVFRVVDTQVSRSVVKGSGLIARLLPYREWHEFGSPPLEYPPDAAYGLERTLRTKPPAAREELEDPLQVYKHLSEIRRRPGPERAENQLEADLLAEEAFRECGVALSVAQARERIRALETPTGLIAELEPLPFTSEENARRFIDAVMGLWNHTPRLELGEKTPHERSSEGKSRLPEPLVADLLATLAARVDPEEFADAASRSAAMRRVENEWFETPQKELGGRTPLDLLERGQVPPLPAESELPPADVPVQSPASLESCLRNAAHRPWAAVWALRLAVEREWIERLDEGLLRRSIRVLLHHGTAPEVTKKAMDALRGAPKNFRADFVPEVLGLLEQLEHPDEVALYDMLEFLREAAAVENEEVFLRYLDHDLALVRIQAIRGMAAANHSRRALLLEKTLLDDSSLSEQLEALRELVFHGEAEVLRRALPGFLKSIGSARGLETLELVLRPVGISHRLHTYAQWALFPDEYSADDADAGPPDLDSRLSAVAPRTDPEAVRRGRKILPGAAGKELLRLVDSRQLRVAGLRILEAVRNGVRLLLDEGSDRSQTLSLVAIIDAVESSGYLQKRDRKFRRGMLGFLGACLAWAIRGDNIEREWHEAKENPKKIVSLCRVDSDGFDRRRLQQVANVVSGDQIAELARSSDYGVAENALAVAAIQEPEKVLVAALRRAWGYWERCEIGAAVAKRHGDRVLPLLVEWVTDDSDDDNREAFLRTLAVLGTQRAALVARQTMESIWFRGGEPPAPFVGFQPVLELGDVGLARYALEKFESGGFDLGFEATRTAERVECSQEVAMLLEMLDRNDDPERVVDAAIERFSAEGEEEQTNGKPQHSSSSLGQASVGPLPFDDVSDLLESTSRPAGTIRRESAKVGRNDPCPCGSGRKYKKCCDKE